MKRSFSFLVAAATLLIAVTYGLVRLAYGLYLPDVQDELGLSTGAAGFISSGASVVYCIGAVCGFLLAGRQPRALVLASGASAGLGCLAMVVSPESAGFAVGAVLSSAGAGLASPAVVELLRRHAPGEPGTARRGGASRATSGDDPARQDGSGALERAQSMANAGTGPGLVAAGVLTLVALPQWRTGWWTAAGLSVLAAALVVAGAASAGARAAVRAGSAVGTELSASGGSAAPPAPRESAVPPAAWFDAHRRPLTVALLLGIGSAAVWSYGRSLLVTQGADDLASTAAWIALGVGGAAVLSTSRWLVGLRLGTAWAVTGGAVAVASVALVAVGSYAVPTWVAAALFGWGYTAATGVLITWTGRIDPGRSSSGTAALFVTLVLGQAVGAALWGVLIDPVGHPATFTVAASVAAVAVLIGARVGTGPGAASATGPGHAGGGPT